MSDLGAGWWPKREPATLKHYRVPLKTLSTLLTSPCTKKLPESRKISSKRLKETVFTHSQNDCLFPRTRIENLKKTKTRKGGGERRRKKKHSNVKFAMSDIQKILAMHTNKQKYNVQ